MKKTAFISGALFSSIFLISVVFKIMHYQGAAILFFFSLMGIALVFIPSLAIFWYRKSK